MPDLPINDRLVIPEREISVSFARSGGAGGQHVNKVETKVELRFNPQQSSALSPADKQWLALRLANQLTAEGDLIVVSERTRHQNRNRDDAMEKLATLLRDALRRPKARRPTRPTRGSVKRRLQDKQARSKVKQNRRRPADD